MQSSCRVCARIAGSAAMTLVPARTASGRSVLTLSTSVGVPYHVASSCKPPESIGWCWLRPCWPVPEGAGALVPNGTLALAAARSLCLSPPSRSANLAPLVAMPLQRVPVAAPADARRGSAGAVFARGADHLEGRTVYYITWRGKTALLSLTRLGKGCHVSHSQSNVKYG